MNKINSEIPEKEGVLKKKIEAYILENKENMLKDIQELVSFESITGQSDKIYECLVFFLEKAKKMGFQVKMAQTGDSGIVEMGSGAETFGILVHLDVVKTGDLEKWSNPPFSGVVHDGFIWGRGTADDKGAAVMSLYAMKAVLESGVEINKKVQLIVGTCEEENWTDIENFKKEFPIPDYGFSPDGEFPIFNAENGYADLELVFYEDERNRIQGIAGGESTNTIPSKATLNFENGQCITKQGISAHSSTPEFGENAIIKLCKELSENNENNFRFARFIADYFDKSEDGRTFEIDKLIVNIEGMPEARSTIVPTVLCYQEDKGNGSQQVSLNLNVRHKFGITQKDLLEKFEALAQVYKFHLEMKEYLDPMYVSTDLPFLKIMQRVSLEYGVSDSFQTAAGTTYAKAIKNFVSWGPIFFEDPQSAHMEDERLSIDKMVLATKMYARFLLLYSADNDMINNNKI